VTAADDRRPAPGAPGGPPLLLFDDACNLCLRAVRLVEARDPGRVLRIAPLASATGHAWRARCRLPEELDSLVLVEDGRCRVRGDALLGVLAHLRGAGVPRALLRLVPRRLRDHLYDVVARRRHRWFDRRASCALPDPEPEERSVDPARRGE
jgi:predicted DCC family thiol-disulfide oxidoreductase YuxK